MPSIESSGLPLVFKLTRGEATASQEDTVAVKTEVRSLEGMQKEALVRCAPGGVWRLVSDEGPYLNGKDLAPFPLAFFTAGMQFSFLSQFLQAARRQDLALDALVLSQDNRYSMEGSFLRGDALGGARPAELHLELDSKAPASTLARTALAALAGSAAEALTRTAMRNTFALNLNGRPLPVAELEASPAPRQEDPARRFEGLSAAAGGYLPDIITRTKKAEKVTGVAGGVGTSLQAEQKRTLHIHGEARWKGGMLMETVVHLLRPIGSSFRFLCDETEIHGGEASAPPPLAYLTAGVGFCYMTQLGRYAHIKKHKLDSYRIVQRNVFSFRGDVEDPSRRVHCEPVDTEVFLDASRVDEGAAAKLVAVGERTCFLHAAMRGEHPSRLSMKLNGEALDLD